MISVLAAVLLASVSAVASPEETPNRVLWCRPPVKGLPEMMTCADGAKVSSVRDWETKRRGEILDFFTHQIYGVRPVERPANLSFVPIDADRVMLGGQAIRKRIEVRYTGPLGSGSFGLTAFIPTARCPAPAFVLICNRDPKENLDPERKRKTEFWPVEEILKRGFAAIAFFNGELSSDEYREELAVGSASLDWGAGPYGEYLSCFYASPAWELCGQPGLVPSAFPEEGGECSLGRLSYHLRKGAHDLNLEDWNAYMSFAERHGWRK